MNPEEIVFQAFLEGTQDRVDSILSVRLDDDKGLYGQITKSGIRYDYYLTPHELRWDSAFRNDAPQCDPGNVPCGNICLPHGKKCGLGQRLAGAVSSLAAKHRENTDKRHQKFLQRKVSQIEKQQARLERTKTKRTGKAAAMGAVVGNEAGGTAASTVAGAVGGAVAGRALDNKRHAVNAVKLQRLKAELEASPEEREQIRKQKRKETGTILASAVAGGLLGGSVGASLGASAGGALNYAERRKKEKLAASKKDSLQDLNEWALGWMEATGADCKERNDAYEYLMGLSGLPCQP